MNCGFFFGAACQERQGEIGDELRPNAVYAHDPALIPEQARGNMAACTTTERGLGRKGARSAVRLDSALSGTYIGDCDAHLSSGLQT